MPASPPLLVTAPSPAGRSDGIDALRGAFALWLVLAHAVHWAVVAQGPEAAPAALELLIKASGFVFQPAGELHPAVLGFIVLSGYCIHRNGFRAEKAGMHAFAIRRAFRILPVYFAAILVGLIAWTWAAHLNAPMTERLAGGIGIDPACLAAKATFLAALTSAFHPCAYQGNAPLATVMVEVLLYAVYGLFVWFLMWRGRQRWIWAACALAFAASLAVAAFGQGRLHNWWQNSSLYGFLVYWWIGTLFLNPSFRLSRRTLALLLGGWAALTLLVIASRNPVLGELRKLVLAILIGDLIARLDGARHGLLTASAVFGRSGYSLYAFHAPLVYLLTILWVPWWLTLAAAVAFGLLAYHTFEAPLMQLGRRLAQREPGGRRSVVEVPTAQLAAPRARPRWKPAPVTSSREGNQS